MLYGLKFILGNKFNYLLIAIIGILNAYIFCNFATNTTANNIWQTRVIKVLSDIQENSIKNHEWSSDDWESYTEDVLRSTPITNEEGFYKSIRFALKRLGDNHSFFITDSPQLPTHFEPDKASITVEDGFGIITLPTHISFDQNTILNERWVTDFQEKLEHDRAEVTEGWIIDLTRNEGGNMVPMLAALSTFFENPVLGGFAYYSSPNKQEQYLVSFDGQKFMIGNEQFSYQKQFPINKNILPVVALIGPNTASSGEVVALALKRQKNTTLMGQPTRGIATGNGIRPLPDNLGFYALTCAYLLDSNNEPLLKMRVEPKLLMPQDRNALLLEAKRFITDKNISMNKSATN